MNVPDKLRLVRCSSLGVEIARIVSLSREDAKNGIEAVWWKEIDEPILDPDDEPDRHWEWRAIVSTYQSKPYFRAASVKTDDGSIQAAMLFRVDALSALEPQQGAVFVDRLATAPNNRDQLTSNPVLRGGGSGLLAYSVAVSYSLGFSGRVNLFPVANVPFYAKYGFIPTSVTDGDDALYELPAEAAVAILRKRGII